MTIAVDAQADLSKRTLQYWPTAWNEFRHDRTAMIGLFIVVI